MKTKNNIEKLIEKVLEESLSKGDSPIVEATLSKAQLDKREDIIKDLKKNKKESTKKNEEHIKKIASNLEISTREVNYYIEQFNLKIPNEEKRTT